MFLELAFLFNFMFLRFIFADTCGYILFTLLQLYECNNMNVSLLLLDGHLSFLLGIFAIRNYINKNSLVYSLMHV